MKLLQPSWILVVVAGGAFAQEATPPPGTPNIVNNASVQKPPAQAVKQTWDYYFHGHGAGPVLVDAKACLEIGKDGENKSECTKEVPAKGIKAGTSVNVWQAYLVPQGDTVEDLAVQLKQNDQVRKTKDVTVKGESWRTRTWTSVRIPKPGNWTIVILRGNETLKTFPITATK